MNAPVRTVIVDDEAPARERLATLLDAHPRVRIVGQAADIESAAELCILLRPDLVLLDVELRRENGFDLLPRLTSSTAIIFISAHECYAQRASQANALDFLLKPIHPDRLAAALAELSIH